MLFSLKSICFSILLLCRCRGLSASEDPVPAPWPPQFHAVTVMNYTGGVRMVDLWYDWPNKRYFHINHYQLGETLYDVEWNNHTSFVFTLNSNRECTVLQFPVGILPPDWLAGANYLGHRYKDGFLCNVWEKVDFIWYYEDVDTKIPVYWEFYDGLTEHVMKFEVGRVLEDSKWQAPEYCFGDAVDKKKSLVPNLGRHHLSRVGKSYKQYTLLFS
ncbi:uncharacterized protein At4g14100-like [Ipomoea triloba]|uniref:uncharacterized protein At4g14100-like n=1 Tax=Ipomoea triloba TaxID=35885 RepID=UPI00125DB592|nr:uncharacterized protein At4g14100-like [Ipomoea triloba]